MTKMTTYSYNGANAIQLIKTARIEQMQAGNFEIVVDVPKVGPMIANILKNSDGEYENLLTLTCSERRYNRTILMLSRTREEMESLHQQADARYFAGRN